MASLPPAFVDSGNVGNAISFASESEYTLSRFSVSEAIDAIPARTRTRTQDQRAAAGDRGLANIGLLYQVGTDDVDRGPSCKRANWPTEHDLRRSATLWSAVFAYLLRGPFLQLNTNAHPLSRRALESARRCAPHAAPSLTSRSSADPAAASHNGLSGVEYSFAQHKR